MSIMSKYQLIKLLLSILCQQDEVDQVNKWDVWTILVIVKAPLSG